MPDVPFIPILIGILALLVLFTCYRSFNMIGPNEFGLVSKKIGGKLPEGQLIAFNDEAGYQAELLDPGLRFKLWPIYRVWRKELVQVGPDSIGLVIAQVGEPLPAGAKSAVYDDAFGDFRDVSAFL